MIYLCNRGKKNGQLYNSLHRDLSVNCIKLYRQKNTLQFVLVIKQNIRRHIES